MLLQEVADVVLGILQVPRRVEGGVGQEQEMPVRGHPGQKRERRREIRTNRYLEK